MKRVVAIAVVMVMVTTLFTFSVFADTPVQPLQVITYSDTSTNVRISGTAERLHYNVDSFQVVFMNPPNNYGTACTPVLVSFRFYNASDIPAYVGQPEFELTATTGTGSVNTIIYGYDQISTDLFVAESSYSTAEVGRIGIGASNDFAYYTGFVIPPRTSLYFSCIVYVNASAYGQNNTGATEDVNQVTLSALNLYSNQISFSADYPYHNQPIDFSSIIEAIENVADTVSTQSQMTELIDALTYSGNSISNLNINSTNFESDTTPLSRVRLLVRTYWGKPYYESSNIYVDSVNDTSVDLGSIVYPVYIRVYIKNANSYSVITRTLARIKNILAYNNGFYVDYFQSNIFNNINVDNRSLELFFSIPYSGGGSVIPNGEYNTTIIGHYVLPANSPISMPGQLDVSQFFADNSTTSDYYPINEYVILRDLYYSLVKKDTDDNTEEAQDMNDDIHEQEQVWYDNNSEALEAVGLSNYRFSTSQSRGITQAVTQFQAVWNALGDWTNVYIFILILSISTYIIRHEPTTRVKQYRSSVQAERAERISYYGRKNAESRASSSGSTLKNAIRRRK